MMIKRVLFNIAQDFADVFNSAIRMAMNGPCNVLIQSECKRVILLIDAEKGTVLFRPDLVEVAPTAKPKLVQTETCDGCGHVKESVHDFSTLPDDSLFALIDEIDKRRATNPDFSKRFNRHQIAKIKDALPETAKLFEMLDDVFHGEHSRD